MKVISLIRKTVLQLIEKKILNVYSYNPALSVAVLNLKRQSLQLNSVESICLEQVIYEHY